MKALTSFTLLLALLGSLPAHAHGIPFLTKELSSNTFRIQLEKDQVQGCKQLEAGNQRLSILRMDESLIRDVPESAFLVTDKKVNQCERFKKNLDAAKGILTFTRKLVREVLVSDGVCTVYDRYIDDLTPTGFTGTWDYPLQEEHLLQIPDNLGQKEADALCLKTYNATLAK